MGGGGSTSLIIEVSDVSWTYTGNKTSGTATSPVSHTEAKTAWNEGRPVYLKINTYMIPMVAVVARGAAMFEGFYASEGGLAWATLYKYELTINLGGASLVTKVSVADGSYTADLYADILTACTDGYHSVYLIDPVKSVYQIVEATSDRIVGVSMYLGDTDEGDDPYQIAICTLKLGADQKRAAASIKWGKITVEEYE